MYNIRLDKSVSKFLFSHPEVWDRFSDKVEIMKLDPFDSRLDITKLKPPHKWYRLRIGKYRFLYEIIDHQILIYFYEADSRWDIYK
jgi:mRNA interferase RelE/StbE